MAPFSDLLSLQEIPQHKLEQISITTDAIGCRMKYALGTWYVANQLAEHSNFA